MAREGNGGQRRGPQVKGPAVLDDEREMGVVKKLLWRTAKAASCLVLVTVVGFCGFVNFANAPEKAERDRQARADSLELIAALDEFRAEAGRYPAHLEELVPRFVREIPARAGGGPFQYEPLAEGHDFELGYFDSPMGTLPNDGYHTYESTSKEWRFEVL